MQSVFNCGNPVHFLTHVTCNSFHVMLQRITDGRRHPASSLTALGLHVISSWLTEQVYCS